MQEFTYHFISSRKLKAMKEGKDGKGTGVALTAVIKIDPKEAKAFCGVSLCHRKDQFNRKDAVRRARGRAEAAVAGRRNQHCSNLPVFFTYIDDNKVYRPTRRDVMNSLSVYFDLPEHFEGLLSKTP